MYVLCNVMKVNTAMDFVGVCERKLYVILIMCKMGILPYAIAENPHLTPLHCNLLVSTLLVSVMFV